MHLLHLLPQLALLFLLGSLNILQAAAQSSDFIGPPQQLILGIPGLTDAINEEHYGGYIQINGTGKRLYYYLATSRSDPANDPLVLWLNGGPGSSSLIGWSEENGPFTLSLEFSDPANPGLMPDGVSLTTNPLSWNDRANVLYIDQPAGTGLSWSTDVDDYTTNDTMAQADLHQAVLQWFEMYPYFVDHDFYITGESYAGTYIPLLATAILDSNAVGNVSNIQLQGLMLGNPVTYDELDNVDLFQIYSFLSLIPLSLNEQFVNGNCDVGSNGGASVTYPSNALNADFVNFSSNVQVCDTLLSKFEALTNNLYGYDLLTDSFYGQGSFEAQLFNELKANLSDMGINFTDAYTGTATNDASSDDRAATYFFNQIDVREAIHADPLEEAGFFTFGNPRVNYTYDVFNVIPLHEELINAGVRVVIYSGDHDGISGVPWPGSQTWTTLLGNQLGVVADWRPWYKPDPANYGQQTAGYIAQYNGLTYMTVRGAGHQVPTYRPEEAFIMFNNFLDDTLNSTTGMTVPALTIPQTL